jgi:hypothetical protein
MPASQQRGRNSSEVTVASVMNADPRAREGLSDARSP